MLALQNNFDIAIARYNLDIADTDLLRARSGLAYLGVNSGLVTGHHRRQYQPSGERVSGCHDRQHQFDQLRPPQPRFRPQEPPAVDPAELLSVRAARPPVPMESLLQHWARVRWIFPLGTAGSGVDGYRATWRGRIFLRLRICLPVPSS